MFPLLAALAALTLFAAAKQASPCPSKCECTATIVRCMEGDLRAIPSNIPPTTTVLDLRFNRLSSLKSLPPLPHLRTLLLNNNELAELGPGVFRALGQLRALYLYQNRLEHLPDDLLGGLVSLQSLYLQSNRLGSLSAASLAGAPQLRRLQLSQNHLTKLDDAVVRRLQGLEEVRLEGNRLRCDCRLLSLAELLQSRPDLSPPSRQLRCVTPPALQHRLVSDLSIAELGCHSPAVVAQPRSANVRLGQPLRLDCGLEGDPKPSLTWLHNSTALRDGATVSRNGSLLISRARSDDGGFWECEGRNALGAVRSKRAQLSLQSPPRSAQPLIVKPPRDVELDLHQTIVLDCATHGTPRPRIAWTKDGQSLTGTNNIILRADHIIIRNAQKADAGRYACVASSSGGTDTAEAQVHVRFKPEFTLKPHDVSVREGTNIKLNCETVGFPYADIQWLFNDRPVAESRSWVIRRLRPGASELELSPVLARNSGKYTCRASNALGAAAASSSLRIRESLAPRVLAAPDSLRRGPGATAEFRCAGTGEPRPAVSWQFNGSPLEFLRGRLEQLEDGTLRIRDLRHTDAGHYACVLGNIVGSVSADAVLKIEGTGAPPETNIDDSQNGVTDQIVRSSVATAIQEVDRAINSTRKTIYDGKPKSPSELLALFRFPQGNAIELARNREIYEQTLRIIQAHVRQGMKLRGEMERDVEFNDLLSVSHLQLIMELSGCTPGQFQDPCSDLCRHAKFRSYDAQCNNLDKPMQGVSLMPFKRLLPPIYENDFNTPVGWTPEKLYRGFRKPNARRVSLDVVAATHVSADSELSAMAMQWGQFTDHDLDFAVGAPARQTFTSGAICNATCRNLAPCFNIQMPADDPRRRGRNQHCIEMERSSAVCGSGETSLIFRRVARREQLNAITSYMDGSMVYGSSETETLDLRDLFSDHGLLRFDIVSAGARKPYLPFNRDAPVDCQRNVTRDHPFRCFQAGTYIHTLIIQTQQVRGNSTMHSPTT